MGSGVRYQEVTVKSALTRVQGMPFAWSLNPYRGCAHACRYCYAREYHARMGRDTGAGFDREIEVKINFADVLRLELRRLRLRETVALGTGTDPYQPCEGRYRLTRRALEALVASPLPLVVVTKGTLVVRDIDLLMKLARTVPVRVCVSLATVDPAIARHAEPEAPAPRARLEALRRLRAAGIHAGILAAPVLPDLTDSDASLDAVAAAARAHDASFFSIRPLKLDPGVRPHYFAFLSEQFPVLLPSAAQRFADRVNQDRRYVDDLERRVERIRAAHGFGDERFGVQTAKDAQPAAASGRDVPAPAQLRLAI
ncbi:MAG TPA: radical SAM protein [Candidatus Limnocylindria bacterium]|nr:radical SAM protein [Candidatus Limnocylindria bacterium]